SPSKWIRAWPSWCASRRPAGLTFTNGVVERVSDAARTSACATCAHRSRGLAAWGLRLGARNLILDSGFPEQPHHRAPVGKAGLEQVQSNKRGEQVEPLAHPKSEREARQYKCASDQAQITFDGHGCDLLFWLNR